MTVTKNNNKSVVAIFDLDGTITKRDTYIQYLWFVLKSEPKLFFKLPMVLMGTSLYLLKIKNNDWLKEFYIKQILSRYTMSEIKVLTNTFVNQVLPLIIRPKAMSRIRYHKDNQHKLVLLSASLDIYVPAIAKHLGFDEAYSTKVEWQGNRLTGKLKGPNLHGSQKVNAVEKKIDQREYFCIAYGDRLSDINILTWAHKGYWVVSSNKIRKTAGKLDGVEVINWL